MKLVLALLVIFALAAASVPGDGIEGCTGNENPFKLIDTEPTLVAQTPNGKKFTIGKIICYFRL